MRNVGCRATLPQRICVIGGLCLLAVAMAYTWFVGVPAAAVAGILGLVLVLAGAFGLTADLAARTARAEMELENSEARLSIAERSKAELMKNMSHELRTPLNAVIGFSQMMHMEMMGPIGNPIYIDNARVIEDAGHRLLSIVNDILDIAAVDITGSNMREGPVDLVELMNGLAVVAKGRAEVAKISLSVRPSTGLPLLYADGACVKQILSNLINNAIQFTPPGGRVTIGAHNTDDGCVAVAIEDSGVGIAAADMDRVFQAFTIGENVFNRRYQGQGLGLAIARRLTELHGGRLALQSELERGTTVTVIFPRERRMDVASSASI